MERNTPVTLSIYNSLGQIVRTEDQGRIRQHLAQLDISDLGKGVYFLQVQTPENVFAKPFVKE